VAGEIAEVNEDVVDNPGAINEDPYGSWLIKIEMEDADEVGSLMKGGTDALQGWLKSEIDQFEAKGYAWD
jgi:glycine cleavage system H lipoate-binding protein